MRIAIVNHAPLSESGGAEVWILRVTKLLSVAGAEVDIYVPRTSDRKDVELPVGIRELPVAGPWVRRLRNVGLAGFSAPLFNPTLPAGYDMVYSTSIFPYVLFMRTRSQTVIGTHDMFLANRKAGIDLLQVIPFAMIKLISSSKRMRFHTLNDAATRQVRRWGLPADQVPLDFVLPRTFSEPRLADQFRVLFLGRLNRRKGAKLLVGLSRRLAKLPKLELTIAGPVEQEYLTQLPSATDAPQVRVLGYVDERTKYDILAHTDVGLFLSERDSNPIVPLEYVSAGVPVVSTWHPLRAILPSWALFDVHRRVNPVFNSICSLYGEWQSDPSGYLNLRKVIQSRFVATHGLEAAAAKNLAAFRGWAEASSASNREHEVT